MKRYRFAPGHTGQGFVFALDPTLEQRKALAGHFGARRFAYNWTVARMKADIDAFNNHGLESEPPSLAGMRREWNSVKSDVAVNGKTGLPWWREVSKEAFSSGIADAVGAFWNFQKSRSGERKGPRVCFPKFKKKGRDQDRYRVTTGSFGPCGQRHVRIPRVGTVRVHESMRKMLRLMERGRLKVLSMTVERKGDRLFASFSVDVVRWKSKRTDSGIPRIGIDVGVRRLATVGTPEEVLEVVENRKPLEASLKKLQKLYRDRSRCTSEKSSRYRKRTRAISVLQRRIANIRRNEVHFLTSRLAKSHREIVVEGSNFSNLARQKGTPGVRKRRRDLADSALAEVRRQLRYKCGWYGSRLIEADRFYPSSKICTVCEARGDPGWSEEWTCRHCLSRHQRDDSASVNLARYPESSWAQLGPMGVTGPASDSREGAAELRNAKPGRSPEGGPSPAGAIPALPV